MAGTVINRGQVRLVGSGPTLIPARTIRVLAGSFKPVANLPYMPWLRVEASLAESLLVQQWSLLVAREGYSFRVK